MHRNSQGSLSTTIFLLLPCQIKTSHHPPGFSSNAPSPNSRSHNDAASGPVHLMPAAKLLAAAHRVRAAKTRRVQGRLSWIEPKPNLHTIVITVGSAVAFEMTIYVLSCILSCILT